MITANSDWSTRRRRSSSDGKNDPARSRGIFSSRSPAVVLIVRGRCPFRRPARVSVRWCGCAPIHRRQLGFDQRLVDRLGCRPDPVINLGGFQCLQHLKQGRLV
jgi:hypothetical protein